MRVSVYICEYAYVYVYVYVYIIIIASRLQAERCRAVIRTSQILQFHDAEIARMHTNMCKSFGLVRFISSPQVMHEGWFWKDGKSNLGSAVAPCALLVGLNNREYRKPAGVEFVPEAPS